MVKCKIALMSLLVALIHQVLADEHLAIVGDELEGANVCKRIDTYNVTVVVTEMVPYQESKMVWCAQIPPRCRKTEIKLKQVNKAEVLEKMRAIRECCEGYVENNQRNRCIPHCPKPCINGQCAAPGYCKCESGYGGPSCDISCPPSYYGKKCKKKCDCTNGAECDPYDGKCHCRKGYRGDKCQNTCTSDRYGEGCLEVCRCENGGKCNHISGECYCSSGFIGPLCTEKCKSGKSGDECKSSCRCQNGGICDEDTQQCKCPPGWTGDVCANRCQPGRFGSNCTQACECFNGANCDHISGSCICEPGFMGDKCLDQCPFDTFGVNCTESCSCKNSATCDKATGICHCAPGWSGSDCSERQCPDNKFGSDCNETCECELENTELCHPYDGKCECKPGWSSTTCNRPCPFLKYGKSCASKCDCKNNAQCSPLDGACFCTPGFTGEKCDQNCPSGYYGQDCSQTCECKNDAECNSESGQCFCKPGWSGFKCERPCEVNSYGEGCSKTCNCQNNGGCHPKTGECYCSPGWSGESCEKKCDSWKFGQNCTFDCNCDQTKTLHCDPVNGKCICKTEYHGSQTVKYAGVRCESSCPLGYYGEECHHQCNCRNNSSCDPSSGECFCERGWMGKTCDQKCPNGYYGQDCKGKCPENMPPKTTCDHVTGEFKCRPGYVGLTCEHPCKEGTYGIDCSQKCLCKNGGECSHIDGVCHCLPGWSGELCENPCSNSTWGNNCQNTCKCTNNAICRRSDGICICQPGFMGQKCEEVCPEGFFGANCLEYCNCYRKPNSVCHPSHGCVCKSGYKGDNCDQPLVGELSSNEEFDVDEIDTLDSEVVARDLLTESPLTTISVLDSTRSNQSSSTQEVFTFHPIGAVAPTKLEMEKPTTEAALTFYRITTQSSKSIVTELANPTTEAAFTFHPLLTTTWKSNITETTTFRNNNSGSIEDVSSTLIPSVTDFFSDNSKNVLETSTLKTESTVALLPDEIFVDNSASTEKSLDSNEVNDDGMNSAGGTDDVNNVETSRQPSENSDEDKNSRENSGNEYELVTYSPETDPADLMPPVNETLTSTASIFISILTTTTQGNTISIFGENMTFTSSSTSVIPPINPIDEDSTDARVFNTSDTTNTNEGSSRPEESTDGLPKGSNHKDSINGSDDKTVSSDESSFPNDNSSSNKSLESSSENDSEMDFLFGRNETFNTTRKPRMRNFFYYYFITAIKANESRAKEQNKTAEEQKQEYFMGMPVSRASTVWGIFLSLLFVGIILTVLFYYRRRVANLKAEINHVVKYMSDDPNNFDNPVYSFQQQSIVNPDTTLLHRNGMMNNLRQTKPSNMDRLNNFDQDSNSSGRAGAYSFQYDSQLMNQKNHDADLTNPNVYHMIDDDHLYDEIKLKAGDQEEYDHLDYSRPIQPPIPHYHRTTSSAMSTISQRDRDRESNQSSHSNNKFPSFSESSYDAPIPHPKQLNINVPPLPMKNHKNTNLTPSPSSSTASTITQDDNIDAIISIDKMMNKNVLQVEEENAMGPIEKLRDESTD